MNKGELVDAIHEKIGGTKVAAEEALKATIDSITEALCAGDTITLIGFGTFSISDRKARTGRNPQTGEVIKIEAKKAIKFSAGKALKDAINPAKKKATSKAKKK